GLLVRAKFFLGVHEQFEPTRHVETVRAQAALERVVILGRRRRLEKVALVAKPFEQFVRALALDVGGVEFDELLLGIFRHVGASVAIDNYIIISRSARCQAARRSLPVRAYKIGLLFDVAADTLERRASA